MSPAPQDPRPPPLLQTVCQAGLLTLAALMADHAHQLPRPHYHARPLHRPVTQTHDACCDGGKADNAEVDSENVELAEVSNQPNHLPNHPDHLLPALIPPTAPIYSFDEDGDILPLNSAPVVSHQGDTTSRQEHHDQAHISDDAHNDLHRSADTHMDNTDDTHTCTSHSDTHTHDTHTHTQPETTPRKMSVVEGGEESVGGGDGVGGNKDTVGGDSVAEAAPETTTKGGKTGRSILPEIKVEGEVETKMQVPMINFHAGSVEAEEDYLEGDNQLRDFCVSLLGEAGWGSSRVGGEGQGDGLLTVTPQDPATAVRRAQQRVPFSAVVFSERKPSTGDALVLSLGLGADGASTIPDIASKNQGAARERQVPTEAKLHRQCESCGVSPEDCLKRLGLHSDSRCSPAPSPKTERVLHFFRQLQGESLPKPVHTHRCHATSDPEFECNQTPGRPHSRSLASSPTLTEDDGRKSRLVAL